MSRQPDEFITVPEPPEAIIGLGRLNSFLRSAVHGGALIATAVLGAIELYALTVPGLPEDAFGCFGPNNPVQLTEADVATRLRTIQDLIALEAGIRARLPKAQPGIIIPREDPETYK